MEGKSEQEEQGRVRGPTFRVEELGFTFSCFIPKDSVKLATGCDSSVSHDSEQF